MSKADPLRLERLQLSMMESGIDLLILRLPENIVYVSEYWPILGHSFAVLSKEDRPLLFPIETDPCSSLPLADPGKGITRQIHETGE
jgi:Xaa-Pro aminopeptidase